MRNFVLATLLCTAAPACIIVEDDPGSGCPALSDVGGACLSIKVENCPEDAPRFNTYVLETSIDPEGWIVEEFGCAQTGIILVDPGLYDVRIESEGDGALYSTNPEIELEVEDLDIFELDFEFPLDEGFYWVPWRFEVDDQDAECDDFGAAFVEIATGETTDVAPCHYGGWQTSAVGLGEHDVTVSLLDIDGAVITTTLDPIPAEVSNDSEIVNLPIIVFRGTST